MARETPKLRQLTTTNYEINQIQDYNRDTLNQTTNYIDSLATQKTILGINSPLAFNLGSNQNAYIVLPNVIYDPFGAYNINSGTFTSPITGWINVSINIGIGTGGGGTFGIEAQVNKSAINPLTTFVTNYNARLAYIQGSTASFIVLSGSVWLNLKQGDQVRLVYSSTNNTTSFTPITDTQVSYTW